MFARPNFLQVAISSEIVTKQKMAGSVNRNPLCVVSRFTLLAGLTGVLLPMYYGLLQWAALDGNPAVTSALAHSLDKTVAGNTQRAVG